MGDYRRVGGASSRGARARRRTAAQRDDHGLPARGQVRVGAGRRPDRRQAARAGEAGRDSHRAVARHDGGRRGFPGEGGGGARGDLRAGAGDDTRRDKRRASAPLLPGHGRRRVHRRGADGAAAPAHGFGRRPDGSHPLHAGRRFARGDGERRGHDAHRGGSGRRGRLPRADRRGRERGAREQRARAARPGARGTVRRARRAAGAAGAVRGGGGDDAAAGAGGGLDSDRAGGGGGHRPVQPACVLRDDDGGDDRVGGRHRLLAADSVPLQGRDGARPGAERGGGEDGRHGGPHGVLQRGYGGAGAGGAADSSGVVLPVARAGGDPGGTRVAGGNADAAACGARAAGPQGGHADCSVPQQVLAQKPGSHGARVLGVDHEGCDAAACGEHPADSDSDGLRDALLLRRRRAGDGRHKDGPQRREHVPGQREDQGGVHSIRGGVLGWGGQPGRGAQPRRR